MERDKKKENEMKRGVNHRLKEWEEGVRATDRGAEARTTEREREENFFEGKEREDKSGKNQIRKRGFR